MIIKSMPLAEVANNNIGLLPYIPKREARKGLNKNLAKAYPTVIYQAHIAILVRFSPVISIISCGFIGITIPNL